MVDRRNNAYPIFHTSRGAQFASDLLLLLLLLIDTRVVVNVTAILRARRRAHR